MALTGWDSTKKYSITIAAADVPSDEVDFPYLLNLSSASGLSALDITAIFTELGTNSLKIAVEDGDTGNQCYVEIERWDDVNLSAQLWVKIPSLSSTVDTVINFYYDSLQADNNAVVTHSLTYSYILAPSSSYPDSGTELTDGVIQTTDSTLYVGFDTVDGDMADFSLASPGLVDYVDICYIDDGAAGVYSPLTISVATSVDGTTFNSPILFVPSAADENLGAAAWGYCRRAHISIPAIDLISTVRVSFTSGGQWSMFTEVIVGNSGYVGITTTAPAQNVWSNGFAAVYHMSQDPAGTAPQILDSTANANHGTTYGTMVSADLVDGLVGKAISFDGVDDYIDLGNDASLGVTGVAGLTLEASVNTPASQVAGDFLARDDSTASGYVFRLASLTPTLEIAGAIALSGITAITANVWTNVSVTEYSGSCTLYTDGVANGTGAVTDIPDNSAEPTSIGRRNYLGSEEYYSGLIGEVRIDAVTRSAGWSAVTNLSNRDQLGTWLFLGVASSTDLRLPINQVFGISADLRQLWDQVFGISADLRPAWLQSFALLTRLIIDQVFSISADLRPSWDQSFSFPDRLIIQQIFGDAPTLRQTIWQIFGDMRSFRRSWLQPFGDAIVLRSTLEQVFSLPGVLRLSLNQDFAITATALRQVLEQDWSIKDIDLLRQTIYQVFGLSGAPGSHLRYIITTEINSILVPNPAGITIERDIDLYYIDAALTIGGQNKWVLYDHGADLVITIDGIAYHLVVVTPKRDRRHGGGTYMVDARSPACRLGPGFAAPVTGELTGMASTIATSLAPGLAIDWQIQDEFYGPGKLIAAEEYPIDIIRKMALAMKGVVQSNPDGSIKVIYRRPVHVDRRQDVAVDYTLSDADDFYSASETPDYRPGYNKYTISNQNASTDTLRMEIKDTGPAEKAVRGYQIPWTGRFGLIHTGGSWVSIQPLGIEERSVTETIEFVDGKSRTAYPIYGYTEIAWQAANLGTITIIEDGAILSSVAAESLLEITYTTKCRLWRVLDARNEELQLVSEAGS